MDLFGLIEILGGLSLFLFGMHEMSAGLEKVSGGTLEKTLERFTSNIFKAVLLGLVVTAVIQSSSATTVLVVGLVNSRILKLRQAIGIMMGANIGTTVTGQITRLIDIDNTTAGPVLKFFSPETLAPFIAIIGILLIMGSKSKNKKIIGQIAMGFSILFTGLLSMASSVAPLAQSDTFLNILSEFSKIPILGLLAGMIVTAIIQSSSASVGMLQALSATGALTFSATYPIILGQNIGTCITSVISSIGTSKNAKRAAAVHVYFNLIGAVLFMIGMFALHSLGAFSHLWNATVDSGMIANFHTLFNVITTLLLIPLAGLLEKLAIFTIRDKKHSEEDDDDDVKQIALDDRLLVTPSLAITQCATNVLAMGKLAFKNYRASMKMFRDFSPKKTAKIKSRENTIDRIEDTVGNYMVKLNKYGLPENDSRQTTYLLHLIPEFERIGDHAVNLLEIAEQIHAKKLSFSDQAKSDMKRIGNAVSEITEMACQAVENQDLSMARCVEPLEDIIDHLQEALKSRHIERIKTGKCHVESGILFLDVLTNLERIADQCSNIAVYTIGFLTKAEIHHHEYVQKLHTSKDEFYQGTVKKYRQKYLSKV